MAHDVGCLSAEIMEIYREAGAQTARLSEATGLHCPPGCGRCCHSPKIMASVLEVLPLALDIYRTGDENRVLDAIEALKDDPTCVIFTSDSGDPDKGRCTRYEVRPLVCRLFGFAARHNKYGALEFSGCRVIKADDPHAYQRAEIGLHGGIPIPVYQEFFMQIAAKDPYFGYRVMPINKALREALEYLYWKWPRQIPEVEKRTG